MVAVGLDETMVSLTGVPGIGATWARRLTTAGIGDIEALALAEPGDLGGIRGLSPSRAERWIHVASEMVSEHSAWRYREEAPRIGLAPANWPAGLDPYRLRRARDLTVRGGDGGQFLVTGGLEPHNVRANGAELVCDCVDATRGHVCKHILAVRLLRGDRVLAGLLIQMSTQTEATQLNLFDLWFAGHDDSIRRRQR
jgi:hypothetical protein